jgi:NhaP-type Na+/H+ or K+/H+ antiporter
MPARRRLALGAVPHAGRHDRIGSLYYLTYALEKGVSGAIAAEVTAFTVSVVAISVVVHGVSAQPLLLRYERSLGRA